jgi:hypothetical protein
MGTTRDRPLACQPGILDVVVDLSVATRNEGLVFRNEESCEQQICFMEGRAAIAVNTMVMLTTTREHSNDCIDRHDWS